MEQKQQKFHVEARYRLHIAEDVYASSSNEAREIIDKKAKDYIVPHFMDASLSAESHAIKEYSVDPRIYDYFKSEDGKTYVDDAEDIISTQVEETIVNPQGVKISLIYVDVNEKWDGGNMEVLDVLGEIYAPYGGQYPCTLECARTYLWINKKKECIFLREDYTYFALPNGVESLLYKRLCEINGYANTWSEQIKPFAGVVLCWSTGTTICVKDGIDCENYSGDCNTYVFTYKGDSLTPCGISVLTPLITNLNAE